MFTTSFPLPDWRALNGRDRIPYIPTVPVYKHLINYILKMLLKNAMSRGKGLEGQQKSNVNQLHRSGGEGADVRLEGRWQPPSLRNMELLKTAQDVVLEKHSNE